VSSIRLRTAAAAAPQSPRGVEREFFSCSCRSRFPVWVKLLWIFAFEPECAWKAFLSVCSAARVHTI